jgi:hypothetical protein
MERLELVSDGMSAVDLLGYVAIHPDADRRTLVGVLLTTLYNALIPSPAVPRRRRP